MSVAPADVDLAQVSTPAPGAGPGRSVRFQATKNSYATDGMIGLVKSPVPRANDLPGFGLHHAGLKLSGLVGVVNFYGGLVPAVRLPRRIMRVLAAPRCSLARSLVNQRW
jgi:hypothetical protein